MKQAKNILSIFLVLLMLCTSLPFAFAEDGATVSFDQSDYDIEGTNSLGSMLSSAMESEEMDPYASYNISNVAVEGQTVTASFNNAADCTLVVAAYEEESMQMLCSDSVKVEANAKETSVLLPDWSVENIIIKAFLLDDNMYALCKEYTFRGYTKAYQEFDKKTVHDFDAEKVINLDEAIDNNFLVLADEAIRVAPTEEANLLVSFDFEENVFVFDNATDDIQNLKSGDLFYYDNGDYENMIIITVQSVDKNADGTITVKGETILLEEAFQFIHIDASASDFDLDESTVGEHMNVYEESTNRKLAPKRAGINIEHEFEKTWGFDFDKRFYTNGTEAEDYDDETASVKFSGKGNFGCQAALKFNLCSDYQEVSFVFTPRLELEFSLKGKVSFLNIPLGELSARALGVLKFSLKPKFVIRGSLEVSTKVTAGFSIGLGFNLQDGFVNKCETPTVVFDGIKVEGTIFVGVDLNPEVSLLSDEVAEADMSGEVGVEVTASNSWFEHTWGKTDIHLCKNCIGGKIKFKINLKANLSFAKNRTWGKRKSFDIAGFSFDIADFYWSITFGEHGWGKCPFILDDSNEFNGHYYKFFSTKKNWLEARSFCKDLGGYLVSITSKEETDFLISVFNDEIKESIGVLIGLTDEETEGQWKWESGEEFVFSNWRPGEPNNQFNEDYVDMSVEGTWNDGHFNREPSCFICEWDLKPTKTKAPAKMSNKVSALSMQETIVDGMTASRLDAFPGTEYVLLVVKDAEAENLLASDNLLYIDQKTADTSTVAFAFVPREESETFTATIYGLSHSHTLGEAVIENEMAATCKNSGSYDEVIYCTECGEELSREIKPIEKTAHTPGNPVCENEVEATYTLGGSYDEVVYCSVCGAELSRETKTTDKLIHEHSYQPEFTTAPTCTTDGETTFTCSVCGDTYTESIPATGNHVDDNNDGKCDTCGEKMTGGKHCKYCGKIHGGAFGWLVKFFHSIFAIFKR